MKTNRDLSIERLLRRSRPTHGPTSGECPDVEALAALADDSLSAVERQTVELHLANCDRCQAMTAAMVRTGEKRVGSLFAGHISKRLPTPFSRRSMFTWLVPATAAAAAVAIWVAVPDQRPAAPEERQAQVERPAAPPAPAAEPTANDAFRARSEDRADAEARGQSAAPAESLRDQDDQGLRRQERALSEQESVAPELDRAPVDSVATFATRAAAAPAAASDVVSSDPLIRWRIGPGVAVQYSADGGVTWATQDTGASTPLTAGSSPSPSVCWLVGRAGTVLRSTDSGRQWQRVAVPEAVDLVAVRASSALTATVDLADGRRLGTTDGGRTWALVPK